MFSNGQYLFAGLFVIAFIIIISLSYKKDKNVHSKNYKGVLNVGITFIIFIILLFIIKHFLKN